MDIFGRRSHRQCILLGYDDPSSTLDAWLVDACVVDNNAQCTIRQLQLREPEAIEVLGSGQSKAIASLKALSEKRTSHCWNREPLQMIRDSLRQDEPGPVGGGVQIGFATVAGFELTFDAQPIIVGQPFGKMSYRGFNFDELMRIGNAFVALRGIA
jgi:hypothetical protein